MARRDFPEVPGYLKPTIGSTEVASGATVTTIAGLTLSNPSIIKTSNSSVTGGDAASSTWNGASYPANFPGGVGVREVGGVKRFFLPSQYVSTPDYLYGMPVGSTVTVMSMVCNSGVCGSPITLEYTSSGLYDGNSFALSGNPSVTSLDAGQTIDFLSISYTGTQPEVTLPATFVRQLDATNADSLLNKIKTKKIVLEKFEGNPGNKSQTVSTTWTVPAGVYSIDATLIGGGGGPGEVSAAAGTQNGSASTSLNYGNEGGANTTIIYNGVTYTALGGTKGRTVSVSETFPTNGIYSIYPPDNGSSSGTSSSTNFGLVGNKRPGRGSLGIKAEAFASTYAVLPFNGTDRRFESKVTARAVGENGNDGDIQHFTIPVIPGSTVALSVGQNGGESSPGENGNLSGYASSNPGAIYIRYVR